MTPLDWILLVATTFAAVYWLAALACIAAFARGRAPTAHGAPPVSILKPLRGDDGHLYENLRSVCTQDYPAFEVLCGVRSPRDPATAVVERLAGELGHVDLRLVVDDQVIGANEKVSNVANLARRARHDVLIVADDDIHVDEGYIRSVVAALEDPTVGLVTCLYDGVAGAGLASTLMAMYINEWFLPAALVGTRVEPLRHAFGATMACRRDTLHAVGGFEALADNLADDYWLGRLVSDLGLRVALSPFIVHNVVQEGSLRALAQHELRWARTFRALRPVSYLLALTTHGIPLSLAWLALGGGVPAEIAAAAHVGLRVFGRAAVHRCLGRPPVWREAWLVPVRDVATFAIAVTSFFGRTVRWNGERLRVRHGGRIEVTADLAGAGDVVRGPAAARLEGKWPEPS